MKAFNQLLILLTGLIIGISISHFGLLPFSSSKPANTEQVIPSTNNSNTILTANNTQSFAKATKSAPSTHLDKADSSEKLTRATNENTALKQELIDTQAELNKIKAHYNQAQHQVFTLKRKLGEFVESEISNEQMHALVAAPFSAMLSNFNGEMRDTIYNFHQQNDDLDWGYQMSHLISDFISTHINGTFIEIDAIICKQQNCEIRVIEQEKENLYWPNISKEMTQQNWWQFDSTHGYSSSTTIGNQTVMLTYTFAQKLS